MIKVIENFITEERAQALLSFCKGFDRGDRAGDGFWESRVIRRSSLPDDIAGIAYDTVLNIQQEILKASGLPAIYPDCANFVRWDEGDYMGLHADGDYSDGSYNWRLYGAILYLNDDFEGGEIYFPEQDLELKPKPGTLVFFPGHRPYVHGVREITKGERHNFASFWTAEESRNILELLK